MGDGTSINIWQDPWLSLSTPTRPMGPVGELAATLCVSDLMVGEERHWDREKIQLLLPDYEECILSIKQSVTGAEDKLIWLGTKTGDYSVKSGYYTALEEEEAGAGDLIIPPNFDWRTNIWAIDCAPKVKLFAWKVIKGAIPVGERLLERHIPIDPKCKRCGCIESIIHLLFQCPFARKVWLLAPFVNGVECSGMIDLLASWKIFCANICLPPAGIGSGSLFPWILWSIWKARNSFVFEGFSMSPEDALSSAIVMAREWSRDSTPDKGISRPQASAVVHCPNHTVVVRTDAAWNVGRQAAGFGWVFQFPSLQQQTSKSSAAYVASSLQAEAMAMREAIFECRRLKMKKLRFESDSAQLIKYLNSGSGSPELHGIVADVLLISLDFEFVCFVWIPRERNTVADLLAKDALIASGLLLEVDGALIVPN